MEIEKKVARDELDLISLLSIFFDNVNLLFSVLCSSIIAILIYYLSAVTIFQSNSLLEIKNEQGSFLPPSLASGLDQSINKNSLDAEIAIYGSNNTIEDALIRLKNTDAFKNSDMELSIADIKVNLSISSDSNSLLSISLKSQNQEITRILLNFLNEEYMQDRKDFIRESSVAGKAFVRKEIPRIQNLLKEAEDNLNNFKISTNTSDVIFDTNTRNAKLDRLKTRMNEIEFKELELKEFYRENHPIYLTLSQQKKLVETQIEDIEKDLPTIPSTQRTLENFKREVEIYSNVLRDLSSQELALGMTEASSVSNVRVINKASEAYRISPNIIIFLSSFIITTLVFIFLCFRHFLGEKITNQDALIDFVGKEALLGEMPFIRNINSSGDPISLNVANELINKIVYKITHSIDESKSIAIVSSGKDAGKTEISRKIFEKIKLRHKVCLLDLDFRKKGKGLTKDMGNGKQYNNYDEFLSDKNDFTSENESLFVPSLNVEHPSDFFTTKEFKDFIHNLFDEFDYVICDTPPWRLFVDAQIVSKFFDTKLYIVCNQVTSFKEIDQFKQDHSKELTKIKFFYNKFNLYFNFLWYKYQYPYYSRNYYYDYDEYSSIKKRFTFNIFSLQFFSDLGELLQKWLKELKNRFF